MYRKNYRLTLTIVTIGILSALGFLLMAFVRIDYPLGPWLKLEFSDLTVLIAYVLFSFPGGIAVAVLKTLLDMAVNGLSGPFGIGNITALITSLMYVIGLFISSHLLKLFNKKIGFRIVGYLFITLLVSITLVIFNALFITPTFLSGSFTTCFNPEVRQQVLAALNNDTGYFLAIFILYFPFNLIKAGSISLLYEVVFNRLIFALIRRYPSIKGGDFLPKKETEKEEAPNHEEIK